MAKPLDHIDDRSAAFIAAQKIYFVGTAPRADDGLVNLSPKGLDSLRVLDARTVAYLDYGGSGIETAAHIRENGRIALMFCAMEGPPRILRIHGHGEVVEAPDARFPELRAKFPAGPRGRAIVLIHVQRAADSCGFGVPLYEYKGERSQLCDWVEKKGEEGIAQYQREKNARSLDGLPGLRWVTP